MARLHGAFERKLGRRPEKLDLVWGFEPLTDADSAEGALSRAEATLGAEPVGSEAPR